MCFDFFQQGEFGLPGTVITNIVHKDRTPAVGLPLSNRKEKGDAALQVKLDEIICDDPGMDGRLTAASFSPGKPEDQQKLVHQPIQLGKGVQPEKDLLALLRPVCRAAERFPE